MAVAGTDIVAVGPFAELRRPVAAADVLGGPDALVTPGYVNAHQHLTGDRLIASCIPDDIDSQEAIFGWAVPIHARAHRGRRRAVGHARLRRRADATGSPRRSRPGRWPIPTGSRPPRERAGMRLALGQWGWDVGDGPLAAPAAEVLARHADLLDRYPVGGGLVEGWVTLVGHDLMTDELVAGASELARASGTGLTFHLSPHAGDARPYVARTGRRPFVHLDHLGVLGPHVLVAHGVHVDDEEVGRDRGQRHGGRRLPVGLPAPRPGRHHRRAVPRPVACRRAGSPSAATRRTPATRSTCCAPRRCSAGLVRDRTGDPASFTALDALALATSAGAAAIGQGGRARGP